MWKLYKRIQKLEQDSRDTLQFAREVNERFDDIYRRLTSIEKDTAPIRTYYGDSMIWRAAVSPDVSVRNVVLALIDALGYKIEWDKGTPARVRLDKTPKK